ncbi:MAG TPA: M17 family metallopeptidase, partial [Candidatus Glassbacteria bacterium]|nr:M17 family metallopeptidase [Candidatus Glassbacteria bacterium]
IRCAALVAAVENMPCGGSYKPDDVVRALNGMTIEVGNTDAEGRVTLADSLSWAVSKLGATRIIDLATLTGACVVGLGPTTAGVFGNDGDWTRLVIEAAGAAGEKVCQLPLDEDLADDIRSEVADVKNMGATRFGGAITGALFLQKFVGELPWVHLDIAGPSWAEKRRHYEAVGGTGYGVRTLVRLAERLAAGRRQK